MFVDLMPIAVTQTLEEAPFELACLGNAMKYGYLRGLITRLFKESAHA